MKFEPIRSSIFELMHDLGTGLKDPETLMLGGGNPALLNNTEEFFSPYLQKLAKDKGFFKSAFQSYVHPQGDKHFIETACEYFRQTNKWNLSPNNLCMTQGSQQGFYMLYNFLIGRFGNIETSQHPMLALIKVPDYIGYFDLIPSHNFTSIEGKIHQTGEQTFIYKIDFEKLVDVLERDRNNSNPQIVALIISSPNNPSSHVLSQSEIDTICQLAEKYDKLIVFDHAYGSPFPNIIYGEKAYFPFTEHTIHCYSFSKLGLPGIRTGIMIGPSQVIENITILNGIINLAPSSFTCLLLAEILQHQGIAKYIDDELKPFYNQRMKLVSEFLLEHIEGIPVQIHEPQGGFFLWLRASEIGISSHDLYTKLKKEKVVVVPGNYFYLNEPNDGAAYLRISFTAEEKQVLRGLKIIADTIRKEYS